MPSPGGRHIATRFLSKTYNGLCGTLQGAIVVGRRPRPRVRALRAFTRGYPSPAPAGAVMSFQGVLLFRHPAYLSRLAVNLPPTS